MAVDYYWSTILGPNNKIEKLCSSNHENDAVNNDKMNLSFLSSDIYQMPCQEFFYDCAAIPIPAVDSVCRFGMLRWTMENQYIITTILTEDISVYQ